MSSADNKQPLLAVEHRGTDSSEVSTSQQQADGEFNSTEAPLLIHGEGDGAGAGEENGDVEALHRKHAAAGRGSHWIMTTCLLLGDMFGLGTLTLPADFARLGWAIALAVLVLFAAGMVYSGVLFARLARHCPQANAFDEWGRLALGRTGQRLVYGTVYVVILLEPAIFQLTCMESLQQILYQTSISRLAAGGVVAIMILPLGMVQGIEEVSMLSILGTVGMLTAVLTATGKLLALDSSDIVAPEPVHRANFNITLIAVMDMVFMFGGQANWVRYIGGMRNRVHFKYAAGVTSAFMTVVYIVMGFVGYLKLGQHFDQSKPITSILPQDVWSVVANIGVFVHCAIAYLINLNVWSHTAIHVVAPRFNEEPSCHSLGGRLVWAGVTTAGVAFAWLVAAGVPDFSLMLAVIASVGDLTAAYALPAAFCLKLLGDQMPRWERGLCWTLIPVSVAVSGLGVFSSMQQLVQQLVHERFPG